MIYLELFLSFLQIGLFSIGGGYAAMPLIQSQAVTEHAWLTMDEFSDLVTIAEMTPGPIAVNAATFVGNRTAGFPGALVATLGCIFPSLVIVSLLFFLYKKFSKLAAMQSVLSNLRPAVVALIASAGVTILVSSFFPGGFSLSGTDFIAVFLFAAAFVILRVFKFNPIFVMLGCGVAGLGLDMLKEALF